jgi:hypothetical protein
MRKPAYLTLLVLVLPTIGCRSSTDEKLVEMAREHASRQAESQRQMSDLQMQVAEGAKELVESDAKAREELTSLQREMQGHQAEIGRERDKMEAERREIAGNRYRDPIVAAVIMDVGILVACLLPLIVAVYVLWSARRAGESDSAVAELLVQELVATEPRLLLPGQSPLPRLEHEVADLPSGDARSDRDRPAS